MQIPGDNLPECGICDEPIGVMEPKVKLQRQIFHKECFKCVICDQQLEVGCCGMDHGLCRYFGPLWFCHVHMNLGSGEKYELIKERRKQMRAQ